ncbi:putative endonuclease [Chitinophaga sp. YR627]|uniref:YraN family protein n=1 Tax=Chitinophaga sp. YR627 TaxID=1881041 RepID=UPI0008F3FCA4|nr:YraN family protein [Chitinophaga sp. YR627]SFM94807.1 putative endonuclease [Chitinophaga sp. YR627]
MASHIALGKKGELIACGHLRLHHYEIIAVNWRHRRKEIDIIASRDGCLVFFEVKTLASDLYGWPEKHVTAAKRRNIQAVASAYMDRMKQLPKVIRFDVIAITFQPDGTYELVHFEDAF